MKWKIKDEKSLLKDFNKLSKEELEKKYKRTFSAIKNKYKKLSNINVVESKKTSNQKQKKVSLKKIIKDDIKDVDLQNRDEHFKNFMNEKDVKIVKAISKGNLKANKKSIEINFSKSKNTTNTMLPSSFAQSLRTNIVWQFFRFLIINLKMLIVVSKSH